MRYILLLAAALAASTPAPAGAAKTVTRTELSSQPPAQAHRRLRDATWEMFEREDLRPIADPRQPLAFLSMPTKVHAAYIPGLCRYDVIGFQFAALDNGPADGDRPVQAVGADAYHWFHFLTLPTPEKARDFESTYPGGPPMTPPPLPAWDAACRRLHGPSGRFFFADSEPQARDGMIAFQVFRAKARSDRDFELDCDIWPEDKAKGHETCRDVVMSYDETSLRGVEKCDPAGGDWRCLRLTLPRRQLTLNFRTPRLPKDSDWDIDTEEVHWATMVGPGAYADE